MKFRLFISNLLWSLGLYAQTAVFPGAVATNNQLGLAANNVSAILAANVLSTSTSIQVSSCFLGGNPAICSTAFQANMLVLMDNEVVQVCSVTNGTLSTIRFGHSSCPNLDGRGFDSTIPAYHTAGVNIAAYTAAWEHNAVGAELISIENVLSTKVAGTCLGGQVISAISLASGITCAAGGGGGGSTVPGGAAGQVQYNNFGAFGGFTLGGDGSLNTSSGALTVTKTNGVSFAPSATTDTTNASNIASGNLSVLRLNSGTGAANTTFWRGDGTWAAPAGSGTVTNIGTTLPLSGGPITTTGNLSCPTCVVSGSDINSSNQVTATHLAAALPKAQGGTGTATPNLIAGTNVTIGGTWPNQTINSSATSGGYGGIINGPTTVVCGAGDMTTALNSLLGVAGGIIVLGPSLNCIVTNIAVTANNITLDCAGSTIQAKAGTTGIVLHVSGITNFTLKNCTLDGNSQNGLTYLSEVDNSTNIRFAANTWKNAGTPGASNFAGGVNYFQSSGAIEDNVISQMAGYCSILTNPAGATTYSHNHLDHCYKDGLVVSGAVGNVTVDNNVIQYVYDYDNSSFGAYGNGIYLNSGTSYVNVTGNKISYTTYGGIRVASSSKNNVSANNIDHSGEEGIFLQDFGGGNNNATGNSISDALSMCIDVANAGDNAAFGSNVSGNNCYNAMGVSTNGATTPQYGVCYYGDAWVNFSGNTCNGAYYGIVCDNGEGGTYVNYHCIVQDNQIMDTRPVTLNLSGSSGNCRTASSGAPTEYGFLTSGTNLNSASKSAIILTCQAATNPTWVTVAMIKGWFAAADGLTVVNTAGTSQFTATVSSVVGPGNDNLTLSSVTGFNIFDTVHIGNATGIITCSSVIFATTPCAANHIVVSRTLNGSSFMAAFPASGTLTDDTTAATATISALAATPENMQAAIAINAGDTTGAGQCTNNVASVIVRNNITSGFQIADIDGLSGGALTSLGTGTCITR